MGVKTDEYYMHLALLEAKKAQQNNEVPVGAVMVLDNTIIAKCHNQSIEQNDASAHAELLAIRQAGQALNNYRLTNTTIYVTLEPCAMCFSALVHARINRLVFGAEDAKTGVCVGQYQFRDLRCFNHKFIIKGGVLAQQSKQLLQQFFQQKRNIKHPNNQQ